MDPNAAFMGAIGAALAGAAASAVVSRARTLAGWVAFAAMAVSAVLALAAAGTVLAAGRAAEPFVLLDLPFVGSAFRFQVDGLSAVFLALIAVISLPAGLFAVRYMDHYRELGVRRYHPHVLLFVAGMYGIVTTTDLMAAFCFFWQLMTIPSYLLVRYERGKPENVRAANRYLVMMEAACVLVMVAAGVLGGAAPAGGAHGDLATFDFDRLGGAMPGLLASKGGLVAFALVLFMAGFGIKAGMWPFGQLWLPAAHPAAPSPVSALLSGVMIKTGVYGIIRTFFSLVPAGTPADFPAAGWGTLLAVLGTVTLFVGTVQALKQEQTKRLLAFHSIGQVGYILLGLGMCLVLLGPGRSRPEILALAALGFTGALFHTVNHALFKSLLFLNAGSMLQATGTQDLNRLGGLIRFMPLTGLTALVASFSIAGVPLTNGFASKWSLYAAAFLGGGGADGAAVRLLPLCGLVAVLTSVLTLASFLKFFGTGFLSRTSGLVADRAGASKGTLEASWTMRVPQAVLALACLALGLFPVWGYGLVAGALAASPAGAAPLLAEAVPAGGGLLAGLAPGGGGAVFAPLVLLGVLAALLLMAWFLAGLGGASRREAEPWQCGYAKESDATRYVAHGWYGEVKRYLRWAGGNPGHGSGGPSHDPAGGKGD